MTSSLKLFLILKGCTSCATFLFLPHFDVICDLLLNRRTATWNLFVNFISLNFVHWLWAKFVVFLIERLLESGVQPAQIGM